MSNQQAMETAELCLQEGNVAQAEKLCRNVIAEQPQNAAALHLLGLICYQMRRLDEAADYVQRAIAIDGNSAVFHSHLGVILKDRGEIEPAIAAHRRAVALDPNNAGFLINLGSALRAWSKFAEAIESYRKAIQVNAKLPEAHNNLGNALRDVGQLEESIEAYRRAIGLNPQYADAWQNVGLALVGKRDFESAAGAFSKAVALRPSWPDAHNALGGALLDQGKIDDAIVAFHRAVSLKPDFPEGLYNLATAMLRKGEPDQALALLQKTVALRPGYVDALNNLGQAYNEIGQVEQAIACYDRALKPAPENAMIQSNRLYTLYFHPDYDESAIARQVRAWNNSRARIGKRPVRPHANDRIPDRRLRIGYVSPFFHYHAECFFTVPLLSHHDHGKFEIHCYSDLTRPDDITRRLRGYADVWHDAANLSDEQLAQSVRDDKIDILVDLTMHMESNRIGLFAAKPAPVQVAWLAYPGTTGLDEMDYRITDSWMDPVDQASDVYSETSIRLPDCWCCYDPLSQIEPSPSRASGPVCFGSLNHPRKLNDRTLTLWAQLLKQASDWRLLLLANAESQRNHIRSLMAREGISADRVEFVGRSSREEYLKTFDRIDISLDPLPYNGITTSCDALWMGVPVVSLTGSTAAGRAGLSILQTVGLGELAAQTSAQFLRIAIDLAGDMPRLREYHATLRRRLLQSPLADGERFARNMEAAFVDMWKIWCRSAG